MENSGVELQRRHISFNWFISLAIIFKRGTLPLFKYIQQRKRSRQRLADAGRGLDISLFFRRQALPDSRSTPHPAQIRQRNPRTPPPRPVIRQSLFHFKNVTLFTGHLQRRRHLAQNLVHASCDPDHHRLQPDRQRVADNRHPSPEVGITLNNAGC